jgi:hypothetical protein
MKKNLIVILIILAILGAFYWVVRSTNLFELIKKLHGG